MTISLLFYAIKELFCISELHWADLDKPHRCPGCWASCSTNKYKRRLIPWRCGPCGDIIVRLVR